MKKKSFKEFLNDTHKLSLEQFGEKAAAEQGTIHATFADYSADWIEQAQKATAQDVDGIKQAVSDLSESTKAANVALQKALIDQGVALQKMMDKGNLAPSENAGLKKLDDLLAKRKSLADSGQKGEVTMYFTKEEMQALRQKAVVTASSVANNTDAFRIAEIGQLAYRTLKVYDLFPKVPVGLNSNGTVRYSDWDEATKVRAAAMVAEGGTFPSSTAAWAEYSATMKKIGDSIQITEESMSDRARFVAEIDLFLRTNIDLIVDQQVYDGDGTGNNLAGVYTRANTYTPVASGIVDANIFDLIRKVRTSWTKAKGSKYQFDVCMMNADDIDRMLLKKDGENNYVRPDFFQMSIGSVNAYVVSGIVIIESNAVTANTLLMGDSRFGRIYEEGGYEISVGLVDDNFLTDMRTLKARKRLLMLVREADRDGWLKVTNITTALATLAS